MRITTSLRNIIFVCIILMCIVIALKHQYFQTLPTNFLHVYSKDCREEVTYSIIKNKSQDSTLEEKLPVLPKLQDSDLLTNQSFLRGTCSEKAWLSGTHQRVVSYSFLNSGPRYWKAINETLKTIPTFYPGWQVRIYARTKDIIFLENKISPMDFLFFCDINHLPPPLNNVSLTPVTMWRFSPLGDPRIDVVVFRDTDSEILQREKDAVNEWLEKTNKTLHTMHDHPDHRATILGGCWGLRMSKNNRDKIRDLRDQIFRKGYKIGDTTVDQKLLKLIVWPVFKEDSINHNSYSCEKHNLTSPWPTKRVDHLFVGGVRAFNRRIKKPCPLKCRPPNHQDWEFC